MARNGQVIRDIRANALDKASESNKMSKVYTTVRINQILDEIKQGKKPDLDPFYHGKKDLRDSGITFQRTEEEDDEYKKCAMDVVYFVSNYVKFKNDKGFTLVKLRDYQEDSLHLLGDEIWDEELLDIRHKNNKLIFLQSRLSAKCFTMDTNITLESENEKNKFIKINKHKYSLLKYIWLIIYKFIKNIKNK